MSITHPERALLLYPSLAKALGVELALLFSFYQGRLGSQPSIYLSFHELESELPFWNVQQIKVLHQELIRSGLISGRVLSNQIEVIPLVDAGRVAPLSERQPQAAEQRAVSHLPVVDQPPVAAPQSPPSRGAVPSFGGTSGWRRNKDELQQIFEAAERRKRQMCTMEIGWQPSEVIYQHLPQHSISESFARGCLDEFVTYYLGQERLQSNWDQRFLAWVKRAWRDEESKQAREQRFSEPSQAGATHEKSRRDTRENRKRVTAAIMDLKNLDW